MDDTTALTRWAATTVETLAYMAKAKREPEHDNHDGEAWRGWDGLLIWRSATGKIVARADDVRRRRAAGAP